MQNTSTNLVDFLNSHYSVKEKKKLITRTRCKIIVKFVLRPNKNKTKTTHVIYVKLRVNGTTCSNFSTGIATERSIWDSTRAQIKGYSAKIQHQNATLKQIEQDLLTLHGDLMRQGVTPTAKMIKDLYAKKILGYPSLIELYETFLAEHEQKVRVSTMYQHRSSQKKLINYLTETNQKTVRINEIDTIWANRLHNYLHKNGSTIPIIDRLIKRISQVLDFAVFTGKLEENPIRNYKTQKAKSKSPDFLNQEEITNLMNFRFDANQNITKKAGRPCNWEKKMEDTLNIFLFGCFTGLSCCDLLRFDPEKHIKMDNDGIHYIVINRQKNSNICFIPLLKEAKEILNRFEGKLPKLRNDEYNSLLKKVAKRIDLPNPNRFKTHLARKTAATLLLNRGVPIHLVSRVLGHTSVRTTEKYYATLLNSTMKSCFSDLGLI